jgi:hypothetical protein
MKPIFGSIIDSFLGDDREPNWKELELKEAKESGEEWLSLSSDEADEKFLSDLSKGAARSKTKEATLETRLAEKAAAPSRLGASQTASTRVAASPSDYKNPVGDDNSLFNEVTETLESAEKGATVEKKSRTDAEVLNWVKKLLNEGVPPAKIASKLKKMAEIELFNHQTATDYLNRNAGNLGIAFMQPNAFMSPKLGNSNDCARQEAAWKKAGITVRAKSVKQIDACAGCSYKSKNGSQSTCNLYHLPIIANAKELAGVVNKITAGVPQSSKRAALVQIANRTTEIVQNSRSTGAPFTHQAAFTHERSQEFKETRHFGSSQVQALHAKGYALNTIVKAAEKKFGLLETSKALKGFIASLRKEKGKIVLAKADADYLKKVGIHNESIIGATKCASCEAHSGKAIQKAASTDRVTRVTQKFTERSLADARNSQNKTAFKFDAHSVETLHLKGHSLAKIHKAASAKVGEMVAKKAITEFVASLKTRKIKVALSQIDCKYLKNKLGMQNAIIGESKCGSCNFRHGMSCSLTGGTLLSFPGMAQTASNHKIAAGAPEDGRSMLKEYDLFKTAAQGDIDMSAPARAEVEMDSKPNAGDLEHQ